MKKLFLIIVVLSCAFVGFSFQSKNKHTSPKAGKLKTMKYAGTYKFGSYGDASKPGAGGQIIIYALTDEAVLFYLDVSSGAPAYNMGSIYGKLLVNGDKSVFNKKLDYDDRPCDLAFNFKNNTLTISTASNGCGFGGQVVADGTYKKINSKQPKYFEDVHSTKVYFDKTTPEDYYK